MPLVSLEVIAPLPTSFFHCSHCEQIFSATGIGEAVRQDMADAYPPKMLEEAARLSAYLRALASRYRERVGIRVIDSQSLEGFYKSMRFGIRNYPGFILHRRKTYTGWETDELEREIAERFLKTVE
jgi:hypothetical protein